MLRHHEPLLRQLVLLLTEMDSEEERTDIRMVSKRLDATGSLYPHAVRYS